MVLIVMRGYDTRLQASCTEDNCLKPCTPCHTKVRLNVLNICAELMERSGTFRTIMADGVQEVSGDPFSCLVWGAVKTHCLMSAGNPASANYLRPHATCTCAVQVLELCIGYSAGKPPSPAPAGVASELVSRALELLFQWTTKYARKHVQVRPQVAWVLVIAGAPLLSSLQAGVVLLHPTIGWHACRSIPPVRPHSHFVLPTHLHDAQLLLSYMYLKNKLKLPLQDLPVQPAASASPPSQLSPAALRHQSENWDEIVYSAKSTVHELVRVDAAGRLMDFGTFRQRTGISCCCKAGRLRPKHGPILRRALCAQMPMHTGLPGRRAIWRP